MGWTLGVLRGPGLWYSPCVPVRTDADEVEYHRCHFDQPTAVAPADHTWVEDPWSLDSSTDDLPFIDRREHPCSLTHLPGF